MTASGKQRGQVLIILATYWLLFGGGASSALVVYERPVSDIEKAIKRTIPKGERREAMLTPLSHWQSIHEQQDKRVSADREELLELLRRKETQRADLDPVLARLDQTLLVMDWDFLNLRFREKQQVTSAEWAAIVAPSDR